MELSALAGVSVALDRAQVDRQASVHVLKKAQDIAKEQGQQAALLIQSADGKGKNVDVFG
ncbi:MAG: YjfB family protein [Deltaproteobacteria bacterium]|nr:YjfB family protein [Deltaproteobacteria bacterium]